ncbi:XdhC family protein [Erythrobacter sp. R86502]|uniref:XdhC family protein n=1 Tax=Erythrobacter sp. R86502 TaxID=3093846 RepID=UPI0036D24DD3
MNRWRQATPIDDIRAVLISESTIPARFGMATLIEVDGSAPRDPGAQMIVTDDAWWGFLSGGCIEADVARHARAAMADGTPRLLRYGQGSPWIDIKLACGSGISVLVEPVQADDPAISAALDGWRQRHCVLWASDGSTRTAMACDGTSPHGWDGLRYVRVYTPPLRLVLMGDDGAAMAAAALAQDMGWDVVLIAPGGPTSPPFPVNAYHASDPVNALAAIAPDRWTAIAVLSHDREDDEIGLGAALQSDAFYIGAIGARTRLAARIDLLRQQGVSAANIARLHAPIGLPGFGKAPQDVALSLVAEIARSFHSRTAVSRSVGVSTSNTTPQSAVS